MRKVVIAVSAVVGLVAAAYAGFNAWLAWGTPARPVIDYSQPVKGCEGFVATRTTYLRSAMQCVAWQRETKVLGYTQDVVLRHAQRLEVFYRAKRIAWLEDQSETSDACDAFELQKFLNLRDQVSGQKERFALINCHRGTAIYRFVVLPDGTRWYVDDASASPDGTMLATGTNAFDRHQGFVLRAWPTRTVVARFRPTCRVLHWQDDAHLDLTCVFNTAKATDTFTYVYFDARAWRGKDGVWRMQATRWLNGAKGYNDEGDLEVAPGFSLRPLPRFTAMHWDADR